MKKYVWINEKGNFLIVGQRTTHTGYHIDLNFTTDLNQASVLPFLPREADDTGLVPLAAREERRVFLEAPTNDHQ